ncbi:MAG: lipid-transfer protein [bacterium]|nr:lipid-transfer protein [Deltaproteobacteria bacterium]MCP4906776.1 lipid-transfer protein [bacterium]
MAASKRGNEEIAIVAIAQTPSYRSYEETEQMLLLTLTNEILAETGLDRHAIDFTIAGSCDYLSGLPFAFVSNVDGFGAWPPVYESHVEMDGAWALFEAFVRLQMGDIDTVLVAGSGKSSPGRPREIFALQTNPYYHAPLGLDPVSLAGLQAHAMLEAGKATETDFAQVVSRSRRDGLSNPRAQVAKDVSVDELLAAPYFSRPLRKHDLPPISDGASMILIARGDRARELTDAPVWITGIDHRMESSHPGLRDLADSPSTRMAAQKLGIDGGAFDVAELCVRYSPEEILLKEALGLGDSTRINPSGGPLCGHPVMATGLARVCEAARMIRDGEAGSAIAHAASGPALQQNLVCTLEGDA